MVELLIRQPGYPDRVVALPEGNSYVGRAEDNTIILADIGVSRRHAVIIVNGEQARVEDMGSGNGTYFHGQRVDRQILSDGDELVIDPFVLRFRVRSRLAQSERWDSEGARLDIIRSDTDAIASFAIGPRGVTIGRSETRDIVITDPAASRHHCTIFPKDHGYLLRDMGSANGIYLNGQRVREHRLVNNDIIRIGNTEIRLVLGDSTKVAAAPQPQPQPQPQRPAPPSDPAEINPSDPELRTSPGPALNHQLRANLLPMAIGSVMALLVLGLLGLTSGLGLIVWLDFSSEHLKPPAYVLNLPDDLPNDDVDLLSNKGIQALTNKEFKASFEYLYRAQVLQPQNVYLLYACYTAAEFYLLKEFEPFIQRAVSKRQEYEAQRDALIQASKRNNSKGRKAKQSLLSNFSDDPVVIKALKRPKSEKTEQLEQRFNEGVKALNARRYNEAAEAFNELSQNTKNTELLAESLLGLKNAQRGLATLTGEPWRAAVRAQAAGDPKEATRLFNEVLAIDPHNISAKLHLQQLNASKP